MRKIGFVILPCIAAMLLAGCGSKEACTVTVRNLTGESIMSLEMAQESNASDHTDYISEPLADGAEQTLRLGRFTSEQLAEGFSALIELGSGAKEDFGSLMLRDCDVLTFYVDDLSISAAVNVSDEEVQEMIDKIHRDMTEG